ncbi:MAG: beta-eliminating lyase-related protein [Pseudomonadota bacterium]
MNFGSDNTGPAHPKIMEAVVSGNGGYAMPYGNDTLMDDARAQVREVFEAPDAAVYLVATGTAANSLILSTLGEPWQTVFCHAEAHIEEDECNAPEFYMGGAKLTLVDGPGAKMDPAKLRAAIGHKEVLGVHSAQRGPVSITQVTEKGGVHTLEELAALTGAAKDFGLPVHMDGARFANAQVALGCTAAEMTWKSGVDAVSFGGTKNGCMAVEAVVFFDPGHAWEFELRRKRGAHLWSKHRYLSAQMAAYLSGGLWLDMAASANARGSQLIDGLRALDHATVLYDPKANMAFAELPRGAHRRAVEAGAQYYMTLEGLAGGSDDDPVPCRLVTNWATREEEVAQFLELLA